MSAPEDPDLVEFAHRMFDLARAGDVALLANIERGVPATLTDAGGNTLVMLAAYHGHADLVTGLAEHGADVNAANDRGQTPLAGAVFKGAIDVVTALLARGADPDAGSPSALASAEFFGRDEFATMLLTARKPN